MTGHAESEGNVIWIQSNSTAPLFAGCSWEHKEHSSWLQCLCYVVSLTGDILSIWKSLEPTHAITFVHFCFVII